MPRLIIHAGFPKSGTTALQASFKENVELLKLFGILYPDTRIDAHHSAAAALVGRSVGWGAKPKDLSIWEDFVRSVRNSELETVFVSSEFFTAANSSQITRIKRDFFNFEIKVIFTLRPLARVIPSIYQQSLKKGSTLTYPEWISSRFLNDLGELRKSPRLINHSKVIKNWVSIFGADNVTLLLGDTDNPELLYDFFSDILQIEQLKPIENRGLNRSLTVNESELLRRVNEVVKGKWTWFEYNKVIRQGWLKDITNSPKITNNDRFQIPTFLHNVIIDYANRQIDVIRELNIKVFGDLNSFSSPVMTTVESSSFNEQQLKYDFNVLIGNLKWRRRKYRLMPVVISNRIKRKLLKLYKKPAE